MYDWAEFRHFLYLLTILEKGGFRAAAEELHTSQPNLTVQARRFQEHACIRLFHKMKNGHIQPTETGIAFLTLARPILEIREEVIDALIAIERGEIGVVRFGSTSLVDRNLVRTLSALHKELFPRVAVRPTHGDAAQLAREIRDGMVDAAVITLPFAQADFCVEELRRDRIVICLRRDHPLAAKPVLRVSDLQGNLTVIYHPERHPDAHGRLLELLSDAGVTLEEYSCASHPSEMQTLVREGNGLALIREGTSLEEGLISRRLSGVDWTVDTAVIYHKQRHPKTIPILVRRMKRTIRQEIPRAGVSAVHQFPNGVAKRPVRAVAKGLAQ
jgi:DNA-binding transcriptional LysR family regulator